MLSKLNTYAWLVALGIIFFGLAYINIIQARLETKTEQLEQKTTENEQLKANWEKEKQSVLEASKRIKTLNDIIANNQDSKRWADSPLDKRLINELYNQYLSNKD